MGTAAAHGSTTTVLVLKQHTKERKKEKKEPKKRKKERKIYRC
jgi:hypothetical protein